MPTPELALPVSHTQGPRRHLRLPALAYPLFGLVLVSLVMSLADGDFLTVANLLNIVRQVSINAVIAVGMTYVILSGGIDLSVGSVLALAGTLTAGLLVAGVSPYLAIGAGLGSGLLLGALNGVLVAYLGMPSIIVTLATMGIARGLGLLYTGGYPVDGLPEWFGLLGRGKWLGVPNPVLLMLAVFALAWLLLSRTAFGRHVYAIGGNEDATRLSGVRVKRNKLMVYAISGFTAALAGLVLSSRLMSGQPSAGVSFELDAIAAVVMGGIPITGGRGSVIGTLIGALTLGVLNNGLNMMGISPYLQIVIRGVIILFAIYIGRERARRA